MTAVNKFKALVLVTTCVAGCTSGAEQNTPGVPLVSGIAKQSTSVMLPGNTSTVQNMANAASVRPTVALDGSSRVSSIVYNNGPTCPDSSYNIAGSYCLDITYSDGSTTQASVTSDRNLYLNNADGNGYDIYEFVFEQYQYDNSQVAISAMVRYNSSLDTANLVRRRGLSAGTQRKFATWQESLRTHSLHRLTSNLRAIGTHPLPMITASQCVVATGAATVLGGIIGQAALPAVFGTIGSVIFAPLGPAAASAGVFIGYGFGETNGQLIGAAVFATAMSGYCLSATPDSTPRPLRGPAGYSDPGGGDPAPRPVSPGPPIWNPPPMPVPPSGGGGPSICSSGCHQASQ